MIVGLRLTMVDELTLNSEMDSPVFLYGSSFKLTGYTKRVGDIEAELTLIQTDQGFTTVREPLEIVAEAIRQQVVDEAEEEQVNGNA